ncbi:hypothetical protein [Prochlorococcus marinus]|uniref:Uncharacterized protein n=1 Tax=Prochlorococcus marinus (strain MIT 9303) TaxID=59922 RepID=A2C8X9_PROM3|nr:hypothetical protein [Prochlorococcus marinus]ABM77939.1 Hypothetical protein P9303_11901 [Prochlorococcus marinus str. MIT 9303]
MTFSNFERDPCSLHLHLLREKRLLIREVLSGVIKWYLRFKDVLGRSSLDRRLK